MTHKFAQFFFKLLQGTCLTDAERAAIRADFIAHMRARPYTQTRAENPLQTIAFFLFKKPAAITLCLSLVVFGAGSVAYASNNSLPGEALYTIKVNVVEEVKSAFLSKEKKARFEVERTARRIQEATKLASENRLTPETLKLMETHLEEHAQTISKLTETINAEGNAEISADIHTELQATLAANKEIFTAVIPEESIEETQTLIAAIETIEDAAKLETTEAVIALVQNEDIPKYDLQKISEETRVLIEEETAAVRQMVETAPETSSIARKFAAVQKITEEGGRRLKEGAVRESVALFQEAKIRAKEVSVLVETSKEPQIKIQADENEPQTAPPQITNAPRETIAKIPIGQPASAEMPPPTQAKIEQPLPNTPPKIISYPSVPVGAPQSEIPFTWEAFDPENDTLRWEIWWGDGERRENQEVCESSSCPRVSASHTFTDPGLYTARVRVYDGKGESDGYSFIIDIRATAEEQTSAQEPVAPSERREGESITPIRERERRR